MSWFPRVNQAGDLASGAGQLEINGQPRPIVAHAPQWFDDHTVLYKGQNDQPFTYDVQLGVEAGPLGPAAALFAAGGSNWASTGAIPDCIWVWVSAEGQVCRVIEHEGSNDRRTIFVGTEPVVKELPVNWAALEGGYLTWTLWTREGTMIMGLDPDGTKRQLWKALRGQPIIGGPVPYVLIQTNTELLIVQWGTTLGFRITPGEDKNLYPHAVWNPGAGMIDVVWNNAQGDLSRMAVHPDETGTDLSEPDVEPPPTGEKMLIPNDVYAIYRRVYEKYPEYFLSNSEEQRREGNRRAISTIRAKGVANWQRWVWKTAHSDGSSPSKDAMAFVPMDVPMREIEHLANIHLLVWDMIIGAPRALKPNHENDYDLTDQYCYLEGVEPPVDYLEDDPIDPPPPDGDTHLYIGGENDTGICDECGRSRFDSVHEIPESKVQHAWDPGENNEGLCDICQKAQTDSIHFDSSSAQKFLDKWLADNPDAQEFVTKLYHVPEGGVAPADTSHQVRLHAVGDPTNHLTVAAVTTAKGQTYCDALLALGE